MRALRVLGEVDFILCEDTRVTKVLLSHYHISTPMISYHQHSDERKINEVITLLQQGKNLALVTDAGTPGISDPGGKLIEAVINRFGDDMKVESVPGPSAVTAALSISGIATDKFIFMGFPPHKKGRQTFIKKILESEYPVVVYESKHRILKFLEELNLATHNAERAAEEEKASKKDKYFLKNNKDKQISNIKYKISNTIVVCRELSKMHETVYRGEIDSIIKKIKSSENDQRGEFVVIVGK
jgi:16S rRNA (cytidine1402-2'-O)-methyltransferase